MAKKNPMHTGEYSVPVMSQEEVERFSVPFAEVEALLPAMMQEHGIAIVTGVVSEQEVQALEDKFKLDLQDVVDVDALEGAPSGVKDAHERFLAEGPRAFPALTAEELPLRAAGFLMERSLNQGSFAWAARRHPNVHAVFRALFPLSERLVTSQDVTFFTPSGQEPAECNSFSAHVDQNAHDGRPGLAECDIYQGVLYVWPATSDGSESTTVVWPGSHKDTWKAMMKGGCFERSGALGFHYSEIAEMADTRLASQLAEGWVREARRAVVPAGGLFLWNSRTVHTGWKGGPRLAQPVCLEPAERRTEPERIAKLRLAAAGLPSTHWASISNQHDMCLNSPGYFRPTGTEASDGSSHDCVVLPLRPSIRPAALRKDADLGRLRQLVDYDRIKFHSSFLGVWDPPQEYWALLEESVDDDFKPFL